MKLKQTATLAKWFTVEQGSRTTQYLRLFSGTWYRSEENDLIGVHPNEYEPLEALYTVSENNKTNQ